MHILLTGATGYIGKRLLNALLHEGHDVTCCVRDKKRFDFFHEFEHQINIIETDFSSREDLDLVKPLNVDAAFFLIHSLKSGTTEFENKEIEIASNFKFLAEKLKCKQVIYLGGIANDNDLSQHLSSRKKVEDVLKSNRYALTTLRAAIIVGSGSASFEIIRDLVEKLPVMVTPKWVNTKCQPIGVRNVINYLKGVILKKETFNNTYDIGGRDILTYKQMMLQFAEVRGLKRHIYTIPVMTPRLSSYWLYFITATNYSLAVNLVNSMKIKVVCENNEIQKIIDEPLIPYKESVAMAFGKIDQNMVVSSWKDALSSSNREVYWKKHIQFPKNGCYVDKRNFAIPNDKEKSTLSNIWSIGGERGWYYGTWLWKIRGAIDKLIGGIGLRRGRTNKTTIHAGDALDFWRVLVADKENKRLLLYAEMKLPGEAWLEFKIENNQLIQQATFRPRGLSGRLYWYILIPFHHFIFNGMGSNLVKFNK
ncbi:MAG: epimerase [Bacteroidetes bacterium MedPE-SWsnd-G1]|nr:MAG: epimerase [Bacteroidetes bacterium MedPE-SWsnd-G1]